MISDLEQVNREANTEPEAGGSRVGRLLPVAAALLLAAAPPAPAQEAAPAPPDVGERCPAVPATAADAEAPLATVRYLADDALEGRLAGSEGARCAADYIAGRFRRIGLEPAGEGGGYFQPVPLASAVNPHAPGGTGRNVLGLLPGADPVLASQVVVVGAHYDHLGRGGFSSLAPEAAGEVHNGADDNASGVAALLQAARRLASGERPARSVLFVAFTGEELGLLGSSHYASHPAAPLDSTQAMLNLDMVGRLGSDPLIVYGTGTAAEWMEILEAANREAGLELAFQEAGFGPSDHTSFYARDVPVLHFFTNVHEDYHRPGDDADKIDAAGLERVAGLVAGIADRLADRPERLAVVRGAGTPPSEGEGRGYGAWLGTVPDFAPVERGVRISGVSDGSPAEAAGLRGGDVVIGLGEREVADLYGLTDALRAHAPGDTVDVTFLREGEERTVTAVLGSRSEMEREDEG